MNELAIEITNLRIAYGSAAVLEDVSLAVPAGSVCALLGRNGEGKSSLVRCLAGQQRATSGTLRLLGRDPWRQRARLMHEVGIVPEEPWAPVAATANDLVAFVRRLHQRWDAAAVERRLARWALPRTVPFGQLSKGQKAQLMLALALGHAPRLLLLDDPTLGLDAIARRGFFEELIGELADRGTTVLLTTHDLSGAERVADRVAILRRGQLALAATVEDLRDRWRRLAVPRRSAGADPLRAALAALDVRRTDERAWGIEALVAGWDEPPGDELRRVAGAELEVEAATLEEIFATVVADERPSLGVAR